MQKDKNLISLFARPFHRDLIDKFRKFLHVTVSGGGNSSSKVFLLSDILDEKEKLLFPTLWVVNDEVEQDSVARACEDWLGLKTFRFEMLPNENIDRGIAQKNRMRLLKALSCLAGREKKIIIAPYVNLMQDAPLPGVLSKETLTLRKNQKVSQVEVFEKLIAKGYGVSRDKYLEPGQYRGDGGLLTIFPVNEDYPLRVEFEFDEIIQIISFDQEEGKVLADKARIDIYPLNTPFEQHSILSFVDDNRLFIEDELEIADEFYGEWENLLKTKKQGVRTIRFTSFPEDAENHINFRYLSVLKYQDLLDFAGDAKEKMLTGWKMVFFTKHAEETMPLLKEKKINFVISAAPFEETSEEPRAPVCLPAGRKALRMLAIDRDGTLPHAFQNTDLKIIIVSDREIANLKVTGRGKASQKVYWDFLTQLKNGDLVVHIDHGIARFDGLERRTIDNIAREYMRLCYAEGDKLFVPIDQADKVNKFIGSEDEAPRLTRLGSAEWSTIAKKARKETEKIARELLELYARRKEARGFGFSADTGQQIDFEKTFPYEETPGQIKAILEVKKDMEKTEPMDRLICGDVGFGKTEVALRAAFKAVQSRKQVAFISPITILADQHYRTFTKRMEPFHIRVEMLSRFKSARDQKDIIERLVRGEVDVVIGTHRLLQKDVKFRNLGLVIVDEEQRFGVKQKEKFKQLRTEVDILTLTATPIPRTLNICLNKLRDITTITTPPPGRLPVITEVRRFSNELIREAILREVKRGGQIYFLHNRVQTIDGVAEKLRSLVPEAKFGVAHGKLLSRELERRVLDFKDHKFDVLVSSAIIENGIDLPNANTLIVNNADRFGLAQLYQLRGRVGRSRTQAYAYFLYLSQRLRLDAKKRLRAIVEASELGSGFQIAMKDLEIRGAGDILGVKQHGVINVVGVSHFIRMLNRAVEDLQAGKAVEKTEEEQEVAVELPIPAYIPDAYIVNAKEKINVYQRMSAADKLEHLKELKEDVIEDYGKLSREVLNLFRVIELKIYAKQAGLTVIKAENVHMKSGKQIVLYMSNRVRPQNIVYLLEYNSHWAVSGTKLRIRLEHLGLHWLDELRECVKKLAEKLDQSKQRKQEPSAPQTPFPPQQSQQPLLL